MSEPAIAPLFTPADDIPPAEHTTGILPSQSLRNRTSAIANPKSSTGRLDVFTRLIADYGTEFDRVRERYEGPLYAEVCPRAFPIVVRRGSRLMQLRVKRGSPIPSDSSMRELH